MNEQHKANDLIQINFDEYETAGALAEKVAKTCIGIDRVGQGVRSVYGAAGLEKLANAWLKKSGKTARVVETFYGDEYHFAQDSTYEPVFK